MAAVLKPHRGQFQPGNPGGGRPTGARNKLTEVALRMLGEHFAEFGKEAIDRVYRERPSVYLQCVVSLLPKQLSVERLSPFADLSDDEIEQLEAYLVASRAQQVTEINGKAIELEPSDTKQQNKP